MKPFAVSVFALVAALVSSGTAVAIPLGANITISDGNFTGTNGYSNREDNETETNPDTVQAQVWDLEGMFLQGRTLTIVGGFDFKNGSADGGHTYRSGDIFVDVTGDAVYGQAANGGSGRNGLVTATFGYEYAFDLDFSTMTFDVVELDLDTKVQRVTDVPSSNPWRYDSGGTPLLSDLPFSYFSGLTGADVDGLQGWKGDDRHYAISLELPSILNGMNSTLHYTIECGNDNLMGQVHVPDPASTALLLAFGVAGVECCRRKLRLR